MEMHAVSDLGTYEEIADRALIAGNDVILFCSHIERVPDLQRHLSDKTKQDSAFAERFAEACKRADGYREHVARLRQSAPPPAATFDDVIDEAVRFVEKLELTRPHREIVIPDIDPVSYTHLTLPTKRIV